jgi:hypothetical protein
MVALAVPPIANNMAAASSMVFFICNLPPIKFYLLNIAKVTMESHNVVSGRKHTDGTAIETNDRSGLQ